MAPLPTPGEFEQMVLLAILRLGDNAYGVTIRAELLACARRQVSPGALYTTLDRLETKGMLSARTGDPVAERGGRSRRFYTVTKSGHAALVHAQQSFQSLLKGLKLLGDIA